MNGSWSPLTWNGSDPVPGDPDRVQTNARKYQDAADAIERAAARLRAIVAGEDATSDSVDAIRTRAAQVADDISRAQARYRTAGAALATYAEVLKVQQDAACQLLGQAHTAQAAYDAACDGICRAQLRLDNAVEPADQTYWNSRLLGSRADRESADQRLAGLREQLASVVAVVRAAGDSAADQIDDVVSSDGLHDSVWQNVSGFVSWQNVSGFVHGLQHLMDEISTVASVLALFTAWIPGAGEVLGAVALVATVVKLATDVMIQINEGGAGWDIAFDVVGIASFGFGKALSSAAGRAADSALDAADAATGELLMAADSDKSIASFLGGSGESAVLSGGTHAAEATRQSLLSGAREAVRAGLTSYLPGSLGKDLTSLNPLKLPSAVRAGAGALRASQSLPEVAMRLIGEGGLADDVRAMHQLNPVVGALMNDVPLDAAGGTLGQALLKAAKSSGVVVGNYVLQGYNAIDGRAESYVGRVFEGDGCQ